MSRVPPRAALALALAFVQLYPRVALAEEIEAGDLPAEVPTEAPPTEAPTEASPTPAAPPPPQDVPPAELPQARPEAPPDEGGPPEIAARPPTPAERKNTFEPRGVDSYSALRVATGAALYINPGESSLAAHDQARRYLMELGAADPAEADVAARALAPAPARLLMVDLGFSRTALDDWPILPVPKQEDSIYPGEGYSPVYYPALVYGPINAVRAAITLSPRRDSDEIQPVVAVDARVPTSAQQGSTELRLRLGATRVMPTERSAVRLGLWSGYESKPVGMYEPVSGLALGTFVLVPQPHSALGRFTLEYRRWATGEFYDTVLGLDVEELIAVARGHLLLSAGARATLGTLDEEQYTAWTGAAEAPFGAGVDLQLHGRATLVVHEMLRVHAAWSQVVAHTYDPFLDGFYRPTGPQLSGSVSGLFLKVIGVSASLTGAYWTGASPRPEGWTEDAPPVESWWSTMLTVSLSAGF